MIRRLLRRGRDVLPPRVVRAARAAALAWGWVSADLRPPPDILVVGAQRAGTTTLFRLLSEHPGLRRPTLTKGTGYFDDNFGHGMRWYRAHFPLRSPRRSAARPLAFECSGYYLFHPCAPERIARALPGVQVVVMVRDPVARAYSAYRHEVARGFETLSFEEALAQEAERTAGEADRLRDHPGAVSHEHRHHAYVQRGEYARQIARFRAAVGADHVHVVDADRLFADPVGVFADLQRRLGLPVWQPEEVGRWNERPGEPLASDLEDALRHHFEIHDLALAELLGARPSWRDGLGGRPERQSDENSTGPRRQVPSAPPAAVGDDPAPAGTSRAVASRPAAGRGGQAAVRQPGDGERRRVRGRHP